jgi:hypothetical protein
LRVDVAASRHGTDLRTSAAKFDYQGNYSRQMADGASAIIVTIGAGLPTEATHPQRNSFGIEFR